MRSSCSAHARETGAGVGGSRKGELKGVDMCEHAQANTYIFAYVQNHIKLHLYVVLKRQVNNRGGRTQGMFTHICKIVHSLCY